MTTEPSRESETDVEPSTGNDRQALEFLFILIIGAIILAAAITSLSYDPTSARAPWVVLTPLLLLIGIQINRSRKLVGFGDIKRIVVESLKGHRPVVLKVASLIGWMIFLLGAIFLIGHYLGMLVFIFTLLHFKAKESLRLSVIVTLVVTAVIFGLFDQLFGIELYRGLIFRSIE